MAMFCIQVPTRDMLCPVKKRRKFLYRNVRNIFLTADMLPMIFTAGPFDQSVFNNITNDTIPTTVNQGFFSPGNFPYMHFGISGIMIFKKVTP